MLQHLSVARTLGTVSTPQKLSNQLAGVSGVVLWERNNDGPVSYLAPNHHTLSIYQGGGTQTWSCEQRSWGFANAICLLPQGLDTSWKHSGFVRNLHIYFTNQDLEAMNGCAAPDPAPIIYARHEMLSQLARILSRDLSWVDTGDRLTVDHLVLAILSQISRAETSSANQLSPRNLERLEARMAALEEGLPALSELATDLGMSTRHMARLYKATTGKTIAERQREIQITRAQALLRRSQSLKDIALACGFSSQSHFTTVFGRQTGETPAAWRRQRR